MPITSLAMYVCKALSSKTGNNRETVETVYSEHLLVVFFLLVTFKQFENCVYTKLKLYGIQYVEKASCSSYHL